MSEGRLSLTRKTNKSVRVPIADRGFHSWHHDSLAHTSVRTSQATTDLSCKDCTERKIGRHLTEKDWENESEHGLSLFSSAKATLSACTCRKHQCCWTKSQVGSQNALNVDQKNPQYNSQEEILGHDRDLRICSLRDRNRTFEKFVSRKNQHHNLRA